MPKGGRRQGAGRPRRKTEGGGIGKGFATRVLGRIKELKLSNIGSAEDYALQILKQRDGEAHSFFRYMLDRQYGKPAQATFKADTRESSPEVEFGNLPMPASNNPGNAGKPN